MENKSILYITKYLRKLYPTAKTLLNYNTPIQLMSAVILSAQCTDERVNLVTKELFKKYKTVEDFASADLKDMEVTVKSCGLYKNKSKNIIGTAKKIITDYSGVIPSDKNELLSLPGVGIKTANVILAVLFKTPALAVDTHVFRLSRRIGLSKSNRPEGVESDLKKQFPKDKWIDLHHHMIFHGRNICKARKPDCENCGISKICEFYQKGLRV